jgi:hypothetical protein
MEFELMSIFISLMPHGIYMIAWIVAIVFAVRMVRRGGGKAERFLVIGASLMLASSFVGYVQSVLNPWIVYWIHETGKGAQDLGVVFSIIGGFRSLISLAGIVYLVIAFWMKFKAK